jgi:Zn finger protein HypA/HybF involved in hydrogenase expression
LAITQNILEIALWHAKAQEAKQILELSIEMGE